MSSIVPGDVASAVRTASRTPEPSVAHAEGTEGSGTLAFREPALTAGELEQEQDETKELAGSADAAGEDSIESVGWIADEASQHDGADLDSAPLPCPMARRMTRKGVISSTSESCQRWSRRTPNDGR